MNIIPEVTRVSHGHGLPPLEVHPRGRATRCAAVCAPIKECAGYAVDSVKDRCVFYWEEDVEDGAIVEQDGFELFV